MGEAEPVLTFGRSRWPVCVHHAHREQHWRVLEIVEPLRGGAQPGDISRYLLLADGPFAFLKGHDGEQCITATRRGGRWWITPSTSVNQGAGSRPATDEWRSLAPAHPATGPAPGPHWCHYQIHAGSSPKSPV